MRQQMCSDEEREADSMVLIPAEGKTVSQELMMMIL